MAYKQSPANVLKGQMTNKAVGLAHGDSMAMQTDPKDNEELDPVTVTGKKTTSQIKKDLLETIKAQKAYDVNRRRQVVPELAEIDSLRMVERGDHYGARKMYGDKYQASTGRLPSSVTREKKKELYEQATKIQGPRPRLNN